MKLIVLFMVLSLKVSAGVFAQSISLKVNNANLDQVLSEIKKQSGFSFWYDDKVLKDSKPVTVQLSNSSLTEALDKIFDGQPLTYSIADKTIVLKRKPNSKPNTTTAQMLYVSGKVVDEFDKPMVGVTVRLKGVPEKGITSVTSSGKEGRFIISVQDGESILQFSFIGYETRELKASTFKPDLTKGSDVVTIAMKPDVGKLDEVQVQAYGTTTKRLSTGNTATISKEEIEKNPSRNVLEIIKNQVPGLFIDKKSSGPGQPINVTIRGTQVFGYSEPLLIVDGAQFPMGKLNLGLYSFQQKNSSPLSSSKFNLTPPQEGYANGLDFLDPSMIESIDVLKDAAATSVYGSRGAYGVIVITTKKGKSGEPRFNINVNSRLDLNGRMPELLNTMEYIELQREKFRNDGRDITPGMPDINGAWPATRYTNWNNYFAPQQPFNYGVNGSYAGGFNNFTYYLGANFQNDRTLNIGPGGVKRGGANLNLAFNQGGKFDVALTALYSTNADNSINIRPQYDLPPNAPDLILPDGSYNWTDYRTLNNMAKLSTKFESKVNILNTGLTLNFRPLKGLTIETRASYNITNGRQLYAHPSAANDPVDKINASRSVYSTILNTTARSITVDPNIAYVSKLGSLGDLSLRAGFTLQDQINITTDVKGSGIVSDAIIENPTFTTPENISVRYNTEPSRYLGYFGQLNYNWNRRYILDLNARYDGSTKFGPGNRYGLFGSVSGAWIISAEPWFAKALPFVAFGKLRASWGTQGGDGIPNYQYVALLEKNGLNYLNKIVLTSLNLTNPDLQWEKNSKSEIGLDLNFLKGNLTTSFSYYRNVSSNQLQPLQLPTTTGFSSLLINNDATIRNTGFEAVIGTRVANARSFSWNANLNLSVQRNKVVKLKPSDVNLFFNYELGKSVDGDRVANFVGINPQNGRPLFREANGIISADLRPSTDLTTLIDVSNILKVDRNKYSEWVDLSPKFFGALNNRFNYKDFSLGFSISFTKRNVRNQYLSSVLGVTDKLNMAKQALNRWTYPGQVNAMPSLLSNYDGPEFTRTNFGIEDGSLVRLQNADIAWNLPKKTVDKLGLKNVSLQLTGSNLFIIWTAFNGPDPDSQGLGIAPIRTFQGAIKVGF